MWNPLRRKKPAGVKKTMKRVVVGVIIGSAIASIIGKRILDERSQKMEEEKEDTPD